MKVGIGFSQEQNQEKALQEAYRKSLQRLNTTKADLALIFYSYDYGLDLSGLSGALKKVFKYVPHFGSSTLSAWSAGVGYENESGLFVLSFRGLPAPFEYAIVHSLREKTELWATELARQIGDILVDWRSDTGSIFMIADSLNFQPGNGFSFMEKHFSNMPVFGYGTSFGIPQCTVVYQGDVFINSLLGIVFKEFQPWVGLAHSVWPELQPITINRMSENLMIEIDEKPAFYKLSEHLMQHDDLPMMPPDDFRKHMGNLFIVERRKEPFSKPRIFGEPYRVISLLGSEMTTGMVAVGEDLDFHHQHYLGQRKLEYYEASFDKILQELKDKIPDPSFIWIISSFQLMKDEKVKNKDMKKVHEVFPNTSVFKIVSNGEFLGGLNQYSSLVLCF